LRPFSVPPNRQSSVRAQAVLRGFNSVFPVDSLHLFTHAEVARLACGLQWSPWSKSELQSALKADHGFTATSESIRHLIEVLSGFDRDQQRTFLTFVTGCPSLPVGGLEALRPNLTVVRKGSNDAELPSVMTCQNYLKLPAYSSQEVMAERLSLAMYEGRGSFLLS